VARVYNNSAEALVCRARDPCWVCSRMRMEVWRRVRCVVRRDVRVVDKCVRDVESSCGRSIVASCWRAVAVVERSDGAGGFFGSAILQRYSATTLSCVDSASEMVLMLERK